MTAFDTDVDALTRAAVEAPADDAVRYQLADAYREAGDDARADFIETQLALAKLGPPRQEYELESWAFRRAVGMGEYNIVDRVEPRLGDRIDVRVVDPGRGRRGFYPGLLVTEARREGRRGEVTSGWVTVHRKNRRWYPKKPDRHPVSGRYRFRFGKGRQTVYRNKVVWLYFRKRLPVGVIDHIDLNRHNDHPENLREMAPRDSCRQGYDVQRAGFLAAAGRWFDFAGRYGDCPHNEMEIPV